MAASRFFKAYITHNEKSNALLILIRLFCDNCFLANRIMWNIFREFKRCQGSILVLGWGCGWIQVQQPTVALIMQLTTFFEYQFESTLSVSDKIYPYTMPILLISNSFRQRDSMNGHNACYVYFVIIISPTFMNSFSPVLIKCIHQN